MGQSYSKSGGVGIYRAKNYTAAQSATLITSSTHGHFLGYVSINKVGTGTVITLTDGTGGSSKPIATITAPGQIQTLFYDVIVDGGLYVTIAGTGMDITITYLEQTV
jgi:hypothetical protein